MPAPPYGLIADLLRKGQVVPFLGAGVNFGRRPPGAAWDARTNTFLPNAAELSRALADKSGFPSTESYEIADLAKVAAYFVEMGGRPVLRDFLREVLDHEFEPCGIHTYLATIAKVGTPLLIVTTNYDDLLERAFESVGQPYDLVVHPTDRLDWEASVLWWKYKEPKPQAVPPNQLHIDLSTTSVIYKMHGTVYRPQRGWDSYVITEDDYVDFLSRMTGQTAVPALFMRCFLKRHFLFLGYGLRDWNLRVVLRNLQSLTPTDPAAAHDEDDAAADNKGDVGELKSWSIQFHPSELEEELWTARQVKIFDVDINLFVQRLREQGP